jgi:sulfide:quinone oxidoreductase
VSSPTAQRPFRVLIVGGSVAGLEAALALRDLAGEQVAITLLEPEREFVYRPLRVREPFAGPAAERYPLEAIARDLGIALVEDSFKWLEPEQHLAHTVGGQRLAYDALLLALGARRYARFKHALTLDDRLLDEQLHGVIQDVEAGYSRKLAFISPSEMPWPLPLYELALMTARRAFDMNENVSVTIVTPEDAPLELFGDVASRAVARVLKENGIILVCSSQCDTPQEGEVSLNPGAHSLYVDRVVALPELFGPSTPGVPKHDAHGFIPIDEFCQVRGLENVFAAGDATDFPVKHGGVAAEQADTAAASIAALAGAPVRRTRFQPTIHGMLLGGAKPLYLSARLSGAQGSSSEVSETPTWAPATKIAAKYLAPYLQAHDHAALR